MSSVSGAKRIFFYNWPIYLGTWVGAVTAVILAQAFSFTFTWVVMLGAAVASFWSVVSLGVSAFIYDRSALSGGTWVRAFVRPETTTWATLDAGLDAEVELGAVMPGQCIARLDLYTPEHMAAGSIRRARKRTSRAHPATPTSPTALTLTNASCDVVTVIFSAHELRSARTRELFFAELFRVLKPGGRVLLVEHLRDAANFVAFGPGFFHFLPRSEWLRLSALARFDVAHEQRVTPWVMALALEKPLA